MIIGVYVFDSLLRGSLSNQPRIVQVVPNTFGVLILGRLLTYVATIHLRFCSICSNGLYSVVLASDASILRQTSTLQNAPPNNYAAALLARSLNLDTSLELSLPSGRVTACHSTNRPSISHGEFQT